MIEQGKAFQQRNTLSVVKERGCIGQKIKKSVTAIHCKPASKVTHVQWKLMNVCLFHAYKNLQLNTHHHVHIGALNEYFEYKGNNFQLFNNAFKGLQTVLFTWNAFGEIIEATEKEPWMRAQFLSEVIWNPAKREFIYAFGKGIAQQFYIPKYYAEILLKMQNKFSSSFTHRIYEIGMRYLGAPKGSRKYTIQDIRDLLAIQKNQYKNFKQLNAKVLKKARDEINEKSDINLTIEYLKERKKVVDVKFYVINKKDAALIDAKINKDNCVVEDESAKLKLKQVMLIEFNWQPEKSIDKFLSEYSVEHIHEAIEYVRNTDFYKRFKEKRDTGNLGAYLRKAIIGGYKSKKLEAERARRAKAAKDEEARFVNSITDSYQNYCCKIIYNSIAEVLKDKSSSVYDEFERAKSTIKSEAHKYARILAVGKTPQFYRDTFFYKAYFISYLIEKHQMRYQLPTMEKFIRLLEKEQSRQRCYDLQQRMGKGTVDLRFPDRLTIELHAKNFFELL